jgi:tRNA (guanine-N7-)-methyltransferase
MCNTQLIDLCKRTNQRNHYLCCPTKNLKDSELMSNKNKLAKFAETRQYANVYQNHNPKNPSLEHMGQHVEDMKGKWVSDHFKNSQPLILELACGRGEYTVALAEAYVHNNYIGVDVKGARIWQGATIALEKGLQNAAFLRTRIEQLPLFIGENEVDEIWITFPDPFLRESKENKRLTSARFLDLYKPLLKPGAIIHLKTDDVTLYEFTLLTLMTYPGAKILYQNNDIYARVPDFPELEYKTYYERSHLENGRTIKYVKFVIDDK